MIGKHIIDVNLQNEPVTGEVLDKVCIPQSVQMGSPLQGGQAMVMPFDAYLVQTDKGKITIVPVIGITGVKKDMAKATLL